MLSFWYRFSSSISAWEQPRCEWREGGRVPPGAEVYYPSNLLGVISCNDHYIWSMKLPLWLQAHEQWIFVQWGCLVVLPLLLSPKPERRACSKKAIRLLENQWRTGLVGCSYSPFEHKHVRRAKKIQIAAQCRKPNFPKFRKETWLLASAKSMYKMEQITVLVNWIKKKKKKKSMRTYNLKLTGHLHRRSELRPHGKLKLWFSTKFSIMIITVLTVAF